MADGCHLCLLGLIFLSSLLTGIRGVDTAHVFISSGENVYLPCNNALPGCKSTTWNYNSNTAAVELIQLGEKKKDTERYERLSLGSDCSLNIKNVTKEDYGLYTCQQWTVSGQKQADDTHVFLHVLHVSASVSSSSSQTEISADSVTLSCQLYSYDEVSCDDQICFEGTELFWVNQAGVKMINSDFRYQISAQDHCISSLTTTLLNEDHNRKWRCNVTYRNQLKTSATYTINSSAQDKMASGLSTTHTHKIKVTVISVSVSVSAFIFCGVFWLRKRADNRRGTDESAVRDENEHKRMYETVDMSIPATARDNDRKDTVIYAAIR